MEISSDATTSGRRPPVAAPPTADRPVARWLVAIIAVTYGFAKLNGSQFTVLDSELDKPMGSVTGFWLTWYYFGYSPIYGNLIALVQVVGGLLVTHPRFALTGALVLLPVATNIVLVDVFYAIDLGALLVALLMLGLLLRIVAPHARRLIETVVPPSAERRGAGPTFVAPLVLLLGAFGLTYWAANYNNRAPTAVDGVWEPDPRAGRSAVERVFFEYNRAHMVVFKDTSGTYSRHHFELEPDGRLHIWKEWLSRGPILFEATYTPPDRILLRSRDGSGEAVAVLKRVAPPRGR